MGGYLVKVPCRVNGRKRYPTRAKVYLQLSGPLYGPLVVQEIIYLLKMKRLFNNPFYEPKIKRKRDEGLRNRRPNQEIIGRTLSRLHWSNDSIIEPCECARISG